jgi:type II secretory pathway pseudopilin PulG
MIKKRGQIGIEVVVYTLIGLAIIAIVLATVTPKIKEYSERAVINQTEDSLTGLDETISAVQLASGNQREVGLRIRKGEVIINPKEETIKFTLKDSNLKYSQPGLAYSSGDIIILTENVIGGYDITLLLNYTGSINITVDGAESDNIQFTSSPNPYQILIKYLGDSDRKVDIKQI